MRHIASNRCFPERRSGQLDCLRRNAILSLGPGNGTDKTGAVKMYYQLTHDFLVPVLRDWLHRTQKKTARGRAELRLAERSAAWKAKQEPRNLPAWWEAISIWCFTSTKAWTELQSAMMRAAGCEQ